MTRDLKLAALFQALADPTRLRILALLRVMELSVGELAQLLVRCDTGDGVQLLGTLLQVAFDGDLKQRFGVGAGDGC